MIGYAFFALSFVCLIASWGLLHPARREVRTCREILTEASRINDEYESALIYFKNGEINAAIELCSRARRRRESA